MKNFKQYLTPGREKLLQMIDIKAEKESKSSDPKIQAIGSARLDRVNAVFGKLNRPDSFNKAIADKARNRFRSI
jgi:hypothetical protein